MHISTVDGGKKEEWGLKVLVIFLHAMKAFRSEGALTEQSRNNMTLR